MSRSHLLRKWHGRAMEGLCLLAALIAVAPLFAFLWHLVAMGAGAFSSALFTQLPLPPGEAGGGLKNAILGSVLVVGAATVVGIPVGIGAAVFMTEFAKPRVAATLRFFCDVLSGIPSIVMGLLAFQILVRPMHHFSALSGALALAFIMLPVVVITTQEMLHLVPHSLREAGHALGIPAWRIASSISLRAAAPGIITGILLSISRIAGETAPMLFTAFGNPFMSWDPKAPIATLPHTIFNYAISPYEDWHRLAWGGALVLVLGILGATLLSRFILWWHQRGLRA
ncbi:MAG: phosphate ABC transporter permease PstA [Acidobacteriota bacterium]|nr:phosphate ABC transporter permease PstA [Acidobacteriota bacterium]